MSVLLSDEMKSQNDKNEDFYEKCEALTNQTFGYSKKLDNLCQNWLTFLNDDYVKRHNSEFNELKKSREQNVCLETEIQSKQQKAIKEMITKSEIIKNDKQSIDLNENHLTTHLNELQSCVNSLKSHLISKKDLKTELMNKIQALTQKVDELKSKEQELKKENNENKTNECKALTNAMRVMYKTWNNSKVVGLVFNDDENLERIIVVDKNNKSEEQIAEEFWSSLNEGYDL